MPDTPIDLSEGIQSVRLKVPTAEVPIPPEGFAQLHSPVPGELALRLPDGSVAPVGGGGGGGGAATALLGPGGAIEAGNSDPRIGITISAAFGTGIGFTGRFLDQFARPLGVQLDPVAINSAELLALDTVPKVLVPAWGGTTVVTPDRLICRFLAGATPYTVVFGTLLRVFLGTLLLAELDTANSGIFDQTSDPTQPDRLAVYSLGDYGGGLAAARNQPLTLRLSDALTDGDGTMVVTPVYSVVVT